MRHSAVQRTGCLEEPGGVPRRDFRHGAPHGRFRILAAIGLALGSTCMDERKLGRLTGAIYLIVVATGLFSLMYVPATLAGDGAPSDRLERLLVHPALYNAGTAVFLVEQAAFCVLPLMFHRWLRHAGP